MMIANTRSRRTAELFARARRRLAERGIAVEAAYAVSAGGELRRRVRELVEARVPLIVVGGGDGSFTTIVGEFAHRESVLGVLPFGTGNSFARTLGIAPDLEAAIEVICNGRAERVDLGIVNDTYFANFATIGLSSLIGRATPAALKKVAGPLAYVLTGLPLIVRNRPFAAEIRADGGVALAVHTHQLIVANGRYYGVTPLLPDATIVDGKLSLFTSDGVSRWNVARTFVALYRGDQRRLRNSAYFAAEEIAIEASPAQPLDIDGEALGTTPARFRIDPRALRVMVPADFRGT
jgi:diacylglycerol kinase (ATP)